MNEETKKNLILEFTKTVLNCTEGPDGIAYEVKSGIPSKVKWIAHSEELMTHAEAIKWCEEQGGRLPTIHELLGAYLENEEGFKADWYWSSTLDKDESSTAYIQNFLNGNVVRVPVGLGGGHVRCVA